MGHFGVSSGGFWPLAVLLWVSLISIQNGRLVCFGCPLKEYEALSELRSSIVRSNLTSPPTWAGGERDCCLWERVRCNNSTRRVSQLMLSNLWDYNLGDYYFTADQNWQLDLSIFSSFHELRLLNLSYNRINSSLSCIGLKKLEVLDLSSNRLQGSIPSCFGSLSSLTVLNLGDNLLNDILGLQGLKKLQVLDLSYNFMNGEIPISLGNLSSLRVLDLRYNLFQGSIPSCFGSLSSLVDLNLRYNGLNDTLGLQGLKKLKVLDLSYNRLQGSIPSYFGSLSSLTVLNLRWNILNSTLGLQVLGLLGMKKLQILDLSQNGITGGIPISLGNLSSLRVLDLERNLLTGSLPIDGFDGLQRLQELCLQENQLNGTLPPVIGRLASLNYLDLSHNAMEGNMTSQVFANLTSLQYLDLSSNYFSGRFSFLDLANLSKFEEVDLSKNGELGVHLGGGSFVPSFQLKSLQLSSCILDKQTVAAPIFLSSQYKLEALDLSNNDLRGNFPNRWIENQTRLEYLILRNNSIGGSLPSNIGTLFPSMLWMDFSANHLIGVIPPSLGNMSGLTSLYLSDNNLNGTLVNFNHHGPPYLEYVYLDGNMLTGTLPSNLSVGEMLDVHDNQLSGEITGTIQSSPNLNFLNLRGNRFEGRDLLFLCNQTQLRTLDLSNNNFSGRIPHCLRSYIKYISFAGNSFTGSIPSAFFGSSFIYLEVLDLSNNQLSGNLPSQIIGDDKQMAFLILSGNAFEGPVPNQLCKLQDLQMLDLSHNLLSGSIPSCFGKMQLGLKGSFFLPEERYWPYDETDSTGYLIWAVTEVEFVTKGNKQSYQGDHPVWMSGIDLSANRLTGGIPPELGNLSWIISLNLSYNCLTGPIPATFSNLTQIESLDLSHNKLSGMIPWQLTQLTSLEVFSVAHNNLSGCLPEFKNQFATFNDSSYEGNTLLHGLPLEKTCTSNSSLKAPNEEERMHDDRDLDTIILYAVPVASFAVGFWVCIAVLYCNHKGRYIRMQLIDRFADSLCERISLMLHKLKLANQNGIKARHR